jgi:hypothetical protein
VRVSALLTIIGTLLLLLVEQPYPSIRELQQYRLPSIFGSYNFSPIRTKISPFSSGPSSDKPCTSGYIFSVPDGRSPTIVDQNGELIWQERRNALTHNIRVQTFRGQDYLTYWTKERFGPGHYYMVNLLSAKSITDGANSVASLILAIPRDMSLLPSAR